MTSTVAETNIFNDESSQEDDSKTTDSSDSNDTGMEDDVEISADPNENP